jgi:hypothetical protein
MSNDHSKSIAAGCLVVASQSPLPAFRDYYHNRINSPWKAMPGESGTVWEFNDSDIW